MAAYFNLGHTSDSDSDDERIESEDEQPDAGSVNNFDTDPSFVPAFADEPRVPFTASRALGNMHALERLDTVERNLQELLDAQRHTQSSSSSNRHDRDRPFARLLHGRRLYRTVPAASRKDFNLYMRSFLAEMSKAVQSNDEMAMFNSVMDLLIAPSLAMDRGRGGKRRARDTKSNILNKRFQSILQEIEHDRRVRNHEPEPEPEPVRAGSHRRVARTEKEKFEFNRVRVAQELIEERYVSRAMRALTAPFLANRKSYQQIFNDLRQLHPQNPSSANSLPDLPHNARLLFIDPDSKQFIKHLKSMDTGSSPGVSGWSGNMLATLADDKDCRRYLAQLIQLIINGQLPDSVRTVLLASHLIGIAKPNGGTRPIAIGEMFYRCAASYAMSFIDEKDIRSIFLPHQFGVQISNGCETVIHCVQQALSHTTAPHYAICIDMKNAFNEVKRDTMLKSLFERPELSVIWRLAHWCYKSPTALITNNGDGELAYHENLLSKEGTRQGGNESSMLFSLPVQKLLEDLQQEYKGLHIMSIIDDVTLLHTDADVLMNAFTTLSERATSDLNLAVQRSKCQFIYFDQADGVDRLARDFPGSLDELTRLSIPIRRNAAALLGSVVGTSDSLMYDLLVKNIGSSHTDILSRITHEKMPVQHAMILLRMCMVPKLNYIIRTVRPSVTQKITEEFDRLIITTARRLLKLNSVPCKFVDEMIDQMRLKCSMGGLGLASQTMVAHFAYLDSLARALRLDRATHQFLEDGHSHSLLSSLQSSIDYSHRVTAVSRSIIPTSAPLFIQYFAAKPLTDEHYSLQSTLSHEAQKQSFIALRSVFESDEYHMARLNAVCARSASVWKVALPIDDDTKLANNDYRIAVRHDLGIAPFDVMPNVCPLCESTIGVDDQAYHALSCNALKSTILTDRHDDVQACIELGASRAGVRYNRHQLTDVAGGTRRATDTTLRFTSSGDQSVDYVIEGSVLQFLPERSRNYPISGCEEGGSAQAQTSL